MDTTNIKVVEQENGLVTQGLTPELDSVCRVAHQRFLDANALTYWQLVILQIYGTSYVVIFSGASGGDERPNFELGDLENLSNQVETILRSHHEQWKNRTEHSVRSARSL